MLLYAFHQTGLVLSSQSENGVIMRSPLSNRKEHDFKLDWIGVYKFRISNIFDGSGLFAATAMAFETLSNSAPAVVSMWLK